MATRALTRPGGPIATRRLHFIWLADCSGSMTEDGKIQALNHAIREALPHMRQVADDNPNATVLVRTIAFSSGAVWHVAAPTPVEEFRWTDLRAEGVTDMGKALRMVAAELRSLASTGERMLPPVLVLVTDGQPTDDFEGGLQALLSEPVGRKAVRIAIAIGDNADQEILQRFIDDADRRPLQANNPETLVGYIKWASTAVLQAASSPVSQPATVGLAGSGQVPIPKPPPPTTDGHVW